MRREYVIPVILTFLVTSVFSQNSVYYKPDWDSLDSRPIPEWFDEAKFGIFVVWGIYSVPAWSPKGTYAEWYWWNSNKPDHPVAEFHKRTYGGDFRYQDFAPMFTAELFDPDEWADLFARSGARYVVMTAQYHDGFCLWPSPYAWNWNSVDLGPHRDLVNDLTHSVRARKIKMGYYYSVYEWYHPLYRSNVALYVEEHFHPQFKHLVTNYKPSILFMDGEWDHDSTTWRTPELLAWLYNESPCRDEIVVNDRWGSECRGRHGGYYTSEYGQVHGGEKPGEAYERHKWEENQGMGASYGYNRNETYSEYRSATELLHLLIETVAKGGNLLLDVGPTADGRIPVIMQERLVQMGEWLKVNGEAIYGTSPWRVNRDGELVRYTTKNDVLYAICLDWPGDTLLLRAPRSTDRTSVRMLGVDLPIEWKEGEAGISITVPPLSVDEVPCEHAYVFKLTNIE